MRQSFASSTQGAFKLVGIPLQLGFKPFEQGKGIGGCPGKAGKDAARWADAAYLARIALYDGRTQRHLAIASHRHLVITPHAQDGCAVPANRIVGIYMMILHIMKK